MTSETDPAEIAAFASRIDPSELLARLAVFEVLNRFAELTGLGVRIVALPFVNRGLAANRVFMRSVQELR